MSEDFSNYYQLAMVFLAFAIGFEIATIMLFSIVFQGIAMGFFLLGFLFLRKSRKVLSEQIKKAERLGLK